MVKFFGYLAFTAIAVGVWGWFANWFTFATSEHDGTRSFTLDIHSNEMSHDLAEYEVKVRSFFQAVDRKIADLRDRQRSASAKSRPELEQQIVQQEQKKSEAQDALDQLKEAPAGERESKRQKLDEVLKDETPAPTPKKLRDH